jgi:hypothetical protein
MATGVQITGLIKPLNAGSFPVWEDIDGLGGWRSVADVTARNAIPQNFRKIGMVVVTQSDGVAYELVGGTLDANWTALSYQIIRDETNAVDMAREPKLSFANATLADVPGSETLLTLHYQTIFDSDLSPVPQEAALQFTSDFTLADSAGITQVRMTKPQLPAVSASDINDTLAVITDGIGGALWAKAAMGFMSVADITARNAVLTSGQLTTKGMLVYVQSLQVIYQLNNDLATWSFFAPSPALAAQADWFVDSATGSDTNTGLVGFPLASTEEVSRRLCPGGARCTFTNATTTIHLAAGSYTKLDLNVTWPASMGAFGGVLIIIGAVTSTAAITLAVVTTANPATNVRGEITTLAGAFVAQKRIRVTSGAQIASLAWSSGLNGSALDTFVGPWLNFNTNSQTPPLAASTVVVDTFAVTIANLNVTTSGNYGFWQCQDCALVRVSSLTLDTSSFTSGAAGYLWGCSFTAAGTSFIQSIGGSISLYSCFLKNVTLSGSIELRGNTFNGTVWFAGTCNISFPVPNILDAASLSVGQNNYGGFVSLRISGNMEHENGAGLTAYDMGSPSVIIIGASFMWGAASGGTYAIGYKLLSGCWVGITAAATNSFPSTINYQITGHNIAYAGVPLGYPRANCGVMLNSDPGAVAVTT